jgi:hypothetical protein
MLKSFGDDYGNTWSKPIGWCPEFAKRAVPAAYIRLNLWQLAHLAGPGEGRPPFAEVCFA